MDAKELLRGISGILHILAAVTWIGSMIYSEFAVKPALKPLGDMKAHAINGMAMKNFSNLAWTSLIVLILTGGYAFYEKQKELTPLFKEPSGIVLSIKLVFVALLVVVLFLQVFVYGPKLINLAVAQGQEDRLEITKISGKAAALSKVGLYAGVLIIALSVILSALIGKG